MPRKTKGGADILARLEGHIKATRELIKVDRRLIVTQPEDVEERRDLALGRLRAILDILEEELPPLLERAERNREAASLPERVAALEAAVDELRAQSPRRHGLRLTRREG